MSLIQKLIPLDDLKETAMRFPLSVVCALALFVIAILEIHDIVEFDDDVIGRVVVVLGAWYFWFGITQLVGESKVLDKAKHIALTVVGAGGIVALAVTGPLWWMHFWYLTPALLLILMFAPYLKGGDDLSVWFFNRKMWFGVLVSYVALLLFAAGLCTALWAVHELFGVKVEAEVYADIWAFACLVLGPLYALSWVPKVFQFSEEDCTDPPGLKFIVNWISAPMVFIYLLILYAYFVKIIVTGEVPNGHLAYMISGFAGAGIVTYLAAHPLREEGSPQLRLFYRVFFPALLIPVAFHFYAIWERVNAYGFTEQRYMLAVSAIWFAFLAVGNTFWKLPIKAVPMVLGALMIVASFGPWGASGVSGASQYSRLVSVPEANKLLADGKAVKLENAEEVLSFDDRQNISSILQYMCRTERDAMIEDWFEPEEGKDFQCNAYELTKQFGFEYVNRYLNAVQDDYFNFYHPRRQDVRDVRGYDYILNVNFNGLKANKEITKIWEIEGVGEIEAEYHEGVLWVMLPAGNILGFDVQEMVEKELKSGRVQNQREMVMEDFIDGSRGRVELSSVNGEIKDGVPQINRVSFQVLIGGSL